jgi:beta-glucosidase-like glycosyl hydrolase
MRTHLAFALGLFFPIGTLAQQAKETATPPPTQEQIKAAAALPFRNSSLSIEKRVDDLVGRLTLEEKVSQLIDRAPAIPRLDIPAYNWWNEGLHGVARSGFATLFPQAIGNAATGCAADPLDWRSSLDGGARQIQRCHRA